MVLFRTLSVNFFLELLLILGSGQLVDEIFKLFQDINGSVMFITDSLEGLGEVLFFVVAAVLDNLCGQNFVDLNS